MEQKNIWLCLGDLDVGNFFYFFFYSV